MVEEVKKSQWVSGAEAEDNSGFNTGGLVDSRRQGFTWYVFVSSMTAALASFNMGYNTGAPNNPEQIIRGCNDPSSGGALPNCLPMGNWMWGFAVAVFALGGLVGGFFAGPCADRVGRKTVLLWNNLNFIVGAVLLAAAVNVPMFVIGRFMVGVGSGAGSAIVPMYIAEVSTTRYRGAMGALLQIFLALGILISQALGLGMSTVPVWRVIFALTAVPAVLQMGLLAFCPETPRYLISKNKLDVGKSTLQKLRAGAYIENEFNEMCAGVQGVNHEHDMSAGHQDASVIQRIKEVMADRFVRKMLLIGMVIHASQQFSGINAISFYSTTILTEATGADAASGITVGIAALNFVVNCIISFVVDRFGRRPLLMTSSAGMGLFALLLVVGDAAHANWLKVLSVVCYAALFNVGLGCVPFMITPEMVPTWAAGVVISSATTVNWICNFIVGFIFPTLINSMGTKVFIIFVVLNFVFLVFDYFFVPETKGRSVDEISKNH
ncbi:general substrate transporter [Basidiobolus meristosporus CBS 931.73]|uniref:General substrate transporter n=1 Tax=Basidiobolus meristosporus CBS 931.73 TaxID=1314790 RepID=A0A1Y1YGF1_9FUNG|nr:general substrate transporter [Basidiobolus meristosporus CBS 931.73]|eukprot:ORX97091.1 general substrate transporter [Basidiobolus meristosporus CBS 931.73]